MQLLYALCAMRFSNEEREMTQCQSMSISVRRAVRFSRNFRRQTKGQSCRSVLSAERRRQNECFQASAVLKVRNLLRPAGLRAVLSGFPEDNHGAGGSPVQS